jgi:hypothetical protein
MTGNRDGAHAACRKGIETAIENGSAAETLASLKTSPDCWSESKRVSMRKDTTMSNTTDLRLARIRRAAKATGQALWDQRVDTVFADVKAAEPTATREQVAGIAAMLYGPRPAA